METMDRIRQYRQAKGVSQTELAERLGIQQTQYSRYERGAVELPLRYFRGICKELNMSADWALKLDEE